MSYIAFIDMVGTRASAMISNEEYTDAINDFNNSLMQLSNLCNCKIYGYSDNAYIEIKTLSEMVKFFRTLRDNLMNKHRYFTAVIDTGTLNQEDVRLGKDKGFSMKFTAPETVEIYKKQCQFSGIGISLSKNVTERMNESGMQACYCHSIFQQRPVNNSDATIVSIIDLAYSPVILDKLEYLISDYLITAATDARAGRYYLTPAISMIKSLDPNIVLNDLNKLISLLSFQDVPKPFASLPCNNQYSVYFIFALIDFVFSLCEYDLPIDTKNVCTQIIKGCNIDRCKLVEYLPSISTAIITNANKRQFLNVLYNN